MRSIPRPADTTLDTYKACISGVTNPTEKGAYLSIVSEVDLASSAFEQAVTHLTLHQLTRARPVAARISDKKLKDVYTVRMARHKAAGRHIYDRLLASAPGGYCPLCSVGHASTLDHYAPKAKHPMLAVAPINLIPACFDCNHGKHTDIPSGAADHTLHPYFDNIDTSRWLVSCIDHTSPPSFSFGVCSPPPSTWSTLLADRVVNHFKSFDVSAKLAVNAADELNCIRKNLEDLLSSAGAAGVQQHLASQAASRKAARLNSWQTAMYEAMAADSWFIAGGFR